MPDGIGFKEGVQIEKKKIREMSWAQRWQYFKDYYMKITIVIVLLIIAAISIIRSSIKNGREMLLAGEFINVTASDEYYEYLDAGYFNSVEGNEKKQQTEVISGTMVDLSGSSTDNTAYYTEMQIIAQISAKELDYMFMDTSAMEHFIDSEPYQDLREILTDEQLEKYSDDLVYLEDPETGEQTPYGIRVNDLPVAEKYQITSVYGDDAILVILVNGQHLDTISEKIDYILSAE